MLLAIVEEFHGHERSNRIVIASSRRPVIREVDPSNGRVTEWLLQNSCYRVAHIPLTHAADGFGTI